MGNNSPLVIYMDAIKPEVINGLKIEKIKKAIPIYHYRTNELLNANKQIKL